MRSLLSKMWMDDQGAVVAPEIVLILVITVIGIIPGLVALRNTSNAALATIGNQLMSTQTGFTFAGYNIGGRNCGTLTDGRWVASVNGAQWDLTNSRCMFSTTGTIANVTQLMVDPAP